ncbi:ATP-dependent sacrificial sulfur transferase LarE [Roseiconus nitratireducens]|uniref:ATP-dependent sacrificial sulfur transferase LarE n=1 Tax=Roseiconus nitratireducens TaxID=2605748 RepID=A0A5M6DJA4_9BACT|nr:ATP-dependent sacrificial sulfur transferase LarE [Roseiconus nitratireducens]
MPSQDRREACARLDRWFDRCPEAAVAFSGGVDSALVAFWSRRVLGPGRCTAWVADSPSLKRSDLQIAERFCAEHGIPLQILETQEIQDPSYVRNSPDRCFHCKKTLYQTLISKLVEIPRDVWICSGANLDDRGDYRPGLLAAEQAAVRHPLLECGIGKRLIRELAREHGLEVWDKPASPCLSSRIPYGQPVTPEKLARIEAAEDVLAAAGFPICRVRHQGTAASVEVPSTRMGDLVACWSEIHRKLLGLGFTAAMLDPEGFVSGKLNREIGKASN